MEKKRVALVGLSAKFSVADNAEGFWSALLKGESGFSPMESRFKDFGLYFGDASAAGKIYNKNAAFLKRDIYGFDPDFFEVSHKEARHMDVQQRLLLESTYEAMEDAGIVLNGTDTGVYIGGFMQDGLTAAMQRQNYYNLNQYDATGTSLGMLAAKISYFFNLRGPSVSFDTACSSSLTALHFAREAITGGACVTAVCGGVNVITELGNFITLCKGSFLSPNSLCHAFGKRADGYARGEGVGVVILKELSAALADGDRIYCEIVSTRINHDGHTNGITYPNASAQIDLIRETHKQAGISVDDVGYVEAHGTGTRAGDQAEAQAIGAAFARRKTPLVIGSVKTNIGHTEAAAGVASVIKAALMLIYNKIPKTLHSEERNLEIPFERLNLRLADGGGEFLAAADERRYIGINSFGFGGSNAHAVAASVPQYASTVNVRRYGKYLLNISAKSKTALFRLARDYAREIQMGMLKDADLSEICAACATRRDLFEHRLSVLADTRFGLAEGLSDFQESRQNNGVIYRRLTKKPQKCAVIFSGMGVQYEGMGRELYEKFPAFKEAFLKCCYIYEKISGVDLRAVMERKEGAADFRSVDVLQPYNLAYQISLFSLVKSFGIETDGFAGHSVGELAAFYCAGATSLEETFQTVYHRARLQNSLCGKGSMLVLGVSPEEALDICSKYPSELSLAAANGVKTSVISGSKEALESVNAQLSETVFARFLDVDVAYHSHQMDAVKNEFLAFAPIGVPEKDMPPGLYSTVYGDRASKCGYAADYWWQNIRQPVLFHDTVKAMRRDGYDGFIELGARPALSYYIYEIFGGEDCAYTAFQQKDGSLSQETALHKGMANVFVTGMKTNWTDYFGKSAALPLPRYKWDYKSLQNEPVHNQYLFGGNESPVLGKKMNLPTDAWESVLSTRTRPWMDGHRIGGECYFPIAAYAVMLAKAGSPRAKNLRVTSPVVLSGSRDVIMNLTKHQGGAVTVSFADQDRMGWTTAFQANGVEDLGAPSQTPLWVQSPDTFFKGVEEFGADSVYGILSEKELNYSGGFRIIKSARVNGTRIVCELVESEIRWGDGGAVCAADAMLQAAALAGLGKSLWDGGYVMLPEYIEELYAGGFAGDGDGHGKLWVYAEMSGEGNAAEAVLYDKNGGMIALMRGIHFAPAKKADTGSHGIKRYADFWEETEVSGSDDSYSAAQTVFFATDDSVGDCLEIIKIVKNIGSAPARLTVVTENAVRAVAADNVRNYRQSALWGLCRCAALEYGNIDIRLVDVDDLREFSLSALAARGEQALRGGRLLLHRIREAGVAAEETPVEGTCIITGASGGLGYRYALRLAQNGARHMALISRGSSKNLETLIHVLRFYGVDARFYPCDVSDFDMLNGVFARINEDLPPVGRVYHLAGISSDTLLVGVDRSMLDSHFAAKVAGAENLARLIGKSETVRLYLTGSIAGLLGNIGQGAYAAANACLHGLAEFLGCSLTGFGALDTGMTANADIRAGFEKQAIGVMDTRAAVTLADVSSVAPLYVADVDWSDYLSRTNQEDDPRFLYLRETRDRPVKLIERLAGLNSEQRTGALNAFLLEAYAKGLDLEPSVLDLDRLTSTMGINSLSAALIAGYINRELDTRYSITQVTGDFTVRGFAKDALRRLDSDD